MCEMSGSVTINLSYTDFNALMSYGMAHGKSVNGLVSKLVNDFLASDEYNCWKMLREES